MSASALTPPAAAYSCEPTADRRERTTLSTCATTSGRVSAIIAIRIATAACSSASSIESTWAPRCVCRLEITSAMVCGDSLRRNTEICSGGVRREHGDLLRRRAAKKLERAALDRRGQPADDLVGAIAAERAHEHVARVVGAALGGGVLGQDGLDGLVDHVAADLGRDLGGLGDLERERLDLGLAEVLEDLAGALLADRDEQDRSLLDSAQLRGGGGRVGRDEGGEVAGHQSFAIHCLTWAATRSGSRSIS